MTLHYHRVFNLQRGYLIRLTQPFLTYAAGAHAVCTEHDVSWLSPVPIHVLIFDDGDIHALTGDALEALDARVVGFLPQVRVFTLHRRLYHELARQVSRIPGLFAQWLDDRQCVLRVCVQRGAARLDALYPMWWEAVDLETLDVALVGCCVLSQLYGDGDMCSHLHRVLPPEYDRSTPAGPHTAASGHVMKEGEAHGFVLPGDGEPIEYGTLTVLWRREVEGRQVGAIQPTSEEPDACD